MRPKKWIVGETSDHVESSTIYIVHREPPKFVAVYRCTMEPETNTLDLARLQALSLENDPQLHPLPDDVDAFCAEALCALDTPLPLLPGPNLKDFDGSLPGWIIGDDPFATGGESEPTLVVHTTCPRFVVPIFEGVDDFSAQPRLMEFWDEVPSSSVRSCAQEAMKARDLFYERWGEWNTISKRMTPTLSKSVH